VAAYAGHQSPCETSNTLVLSESAVVPAIVPELLDAAGGCMLYHRHGRVVWLWRRHPLSHGRRLQSHSDQPVALHRVPPMLRRRVVRGVWQLAGENGTVSGGSVLRSDASVPVLIPRDVFETAHWDRVVYVDDAHIHTSLPTPLAVAAATDGVGPFPTLPPVRLAPSSAARRTVAIVTARFPCVRCVGPERRVIAEMLRLSRLGHRLVLLVGVPSATHLVDVGREASLFRVLFPDILNIFSFFFPLPFESTFRYSSLDTRADHLHRVGLEQEIIPPDNIAELVRARKAFVSATGVAVFDLQHLYFHEGNIDTVLIFPEVLMRVCVC
jgi:hypothetical protein